MGTDNSVVIARGKGKWGLRGREQRGGNGDICNSVNNKNKEKKDMSKSRKGYRKMEYPKLVIRARSSER